MAGALVGTSVKRREDAKFLTGRGNYTDDINRPGQVHAFIIRSPHAHASLGKIDSTKALKAPGVIAVLTGVDTAADGIGGRPRRLLIHHKGRTPTTEPAPPPPAQGKRRPRGAAASARIPPPHPHAVQ